MNNTCPTSAMPMSSIRKTMSTRDVSTMAEPRSERLRARHTRFLLRRITSLEAEGGGWFVTQAQGLDEGVDVETRQRNSDHVGYAFVHNHTHSDLVGR